MKRCKRISRNCRKDMNLKMFDAAIYEQAISESWSSSFIGCFNDTADFLARGVGVAALYEGELVAGATSYSVYTGGFEIEIITHRDHREKDLRPRAARS
ncbi:MAG: GNAT family N-acetyltransferase [Eubacteriales bacterium]